MSYTPNTWNLGDIITPQKLNRMEQGITYGPYDAVISAYHQSGSGDHTYTILSGNYETIASLLSNKNAPNILVRYWNDNTGIVSASMAVSYYRTNQTGDMYFSYKVPTIANDGSYSNEWSRFAFIWSSNNTITDY